LSGKKNTKYSETQIRSPAKGGLLGLTGVPFCYKQARPSGALIRKHNLLTISVLNFKKNHFKMFVHSWHFYQTTMIFNF